jgi:DNA-directed RNA polymerase subunit RPC12/RpoP
MNSICARCGADILKAGFTVKETRYQCYVRISGQLMRSHASRSKIETFHCMPCGEQLLEDPRKMKETPVAA